MKSPNARCLACRKLFWAAIPIPASCPYCDEPSTVQPVARVTNRMVAESEQGR